MKKAKKMVSGGATTRSKRNRDAYRNMEKMAHGGKVQCKGMGAAKRGGMHKA